ncbi:MAG: transposase [Solirubrobacterales bacterium]|nr:transposase [Solirubrobacterales bacterium]
MVADHLRGQIVWGSEGNDSAAANRFFRQIGRSRSHAIHVISLDMRPGYAKAASEHAPQATIAIDPYHVVALANRALDDLRRAYWNKLRELDDPDAARRSRTPAGRCSKHPTASTTSRTVSSGGGEPPAARCAARTRSRRRSGRSSNPASRSRTSRS